MSFISAVFDIYLDSKSSRNGIYHDTSNERIKVIRPLENCYFSVTRIKE